MRKVRFFLSLLLLLVLPVQGYAMVRMTVLGADCLMHAHEMPAPVQDATEAMPCHTMQAQAGMTGMQPAHDAPAGDSHVCIKCPLCAMNGSLPSAVAFVLTAAPRHDGPRGLFAEPAAVYVDPPLRVPRGSAA
ncbi:MAG: hypothetical protein JWN73_2143 [Betaproteobacteria bacterium]|nr:hypothetical protein [Betaproteobacteria bacterium]